MKVNWFFALLLLTPFGFALFFWDYTSTILLDTEERSDEPAGAGAPQTIVENTELIQFDMDGAPAHILQSDRLYSDESARLIFISSPEIVIDTENSDNWDATSQEGIYDQEDKSVHMLGDVVITRKHPEDDPITISTEALDYYPDRNFAESDTPVIIETAGHRIETIGISVDFHSSVYKLKSQVKSRHDPI